MEATGFHSKEGRLEESLRAAEALIADGDDLAVGKFIRLLKRGGGSSSGHLLLKVQGNIAEFLLDVTDNGMGKGITFIDWDSMGDTISRVHDNTSGTARGIQGEDSLDGNIHGGHVESLEHDLGHLLTVSLWVEWSLSEEDRLLLRGNTELIVEGVVPDLLHVIPVSDDSMLHWVLEGEDTSLGLSLISNIGILLSHSNHHTLVARTPNNGGEDSTRSIISSKPSLAHARPIVNNKSSNVFVTHFECILLFSTVDVFLLLRSATESH